MIKSIRHCLKTIKLYKFKKRYIIKKVKNFQTRYRKGILQDNIMKRCCNFPLLEEKSIEYKIK